MAVVLQEVPHFTNRETEAQRGAVSGLRPHSESVTELGRDQVSPLPACLSLAQRCSSPNTHSGAFRSGEPHHTSLPTGTRGARRSGATILTSGTLQMGVTKAEVRTEGGWSGEWKRAWEGAESDTHSGAGFAIRTRAARASSQTLRGSREV